MARSGGGTRGRSSVTGKFVKKDYAKSHPKTTEIEKVKPKKWALPIAAFFLLEPLERNHLRLRALSFGP